MQSSICISEVLIYAKKKKKKTYARNDNDLLGSKQLRIVFVLVSSHMLCILTTGNFLTGGNCNPKRVIVEGFRNGAPMISQKDLTGVVIAQDKHSKKKPTTLLFFTSIQHLCFVCPVTMTAIWVIIKGGRAF